MAELKKYNPETAHLSPKATSVNIESGAELGVGLSEGTVRRVRAEVLSGEVSRTIFMAEKHFDVATSKSDREDAVQGILKNHALLKAKGLPTFPTLRVDAANTDFLYMTDLTRNGKDAVYSIPDWKRGENRVGKLEGNEERITISNPEELSAQLANLYKKVVNEGCVINLADAFFLVIDKQDYKAKIILGDILEIDFVQDVSEDVVEKNYMSFSIFIDEMNAHLSKESRLRKRPTAAEYHQLLRHVRSSKDDDKDIQELSDKDLQPIESESDVIEDAEYRILSKEEMTALLKRHGFTKGSAGTFSDKEQTIFLYIKPKFQATNHKDLEGKLAILRGLTQQGVLYPETRWGAFESGEKIQIFAVTRGLQQISPMDDIADAEGAFYNRKKIEELLGEDVTTEDQDNLLLASPDSHITRWFRRIDPSYDPSKGPESPSVRLLNWVEASHTDNWGFDAMINKFYPIDVEVIDLPMDILQENSTHDI